MWLALIATAVGCYLLKLAGLSVPDKVLDRAFIRRVADLIPVALLGALVAVQAFSTGQSLTVDARLAGVGAALVALLLKAPFLVVVAVAAVTTALLRRVVGEGKGQSTRHGSADQPFAQTGPATAIWTARDRFRPRHGCWFRRHSAAARR